MRLLRRLAARRQRCLGGCRGRPRVAVEPGLPGEGWASGRDEAGGEARDGAVGRDESHAARLPDQELEDVVDDVAHAGAPLGEVVLVQHAQGFAWKKRREIFNTGKFNPELIQIRENEV